MKTASGSVSRQVRGVIRERNHGWFKHTKHTHPIHTTPPRPQKAHTSSLIVPFFACCILTIPPYQPLFKMNYNNTTSGTASAAPVDPAAKAFADGKCTAEGNKHGAYLMAWLMQWIGLVLTVLFEPSLFANSVDTTHGAKRFFMCLN
jgi:hypothetical protein